MREVTEYAKENATNTQTKYSGIIVYPSAYYCNSLKHNVCDCCFHQQLGVLLVQPINVSWHRYCVSLSETLIENTLQSEFRDTLLLIDSCSHLEKAIWRSHISIPGRVSTTDCNMVWGLFHNLEVICDLGANIVLSSSQLLSGPELMSSSRALIFSCKISTLESIS